MLAIPPSSGSTGPGGSSAATSASSACSIGIFNGSLTALTSYDRSIFSDMSLHDGILTTKWLEQPRASTDEEAGEEGEEAVVQDKSEVAAEDKKEEDEEEVEDNIDDWARQYQERLSRNKQEQEQEQRHETTDVGDKEDIVKEETASGGGGGGDEEYYEDEDENELYDPDAYGLDAALEEDFQVDYTGNSDLYASSFLSGDLIPVDSLGAYELRVGSVSAGEVQLQTLQQEMEREGVLVEYKLGLAGAGAMLLCGGQVRDRFDVDGEGWHSVAVSIKALMLLSKKVLVLMS